jgi:hypothetical protein
MTNERRSDPSSATRGNTLRTWRKRRPDCLNITACMRAAGRGERSALRNATVRNGIAASTRLMGSKHSHDENIRFLRCINESFACSTDTNSPFHHVQTGNAGFQVYRAFLCRPTMGKELCGLFDGSYGPRLCENSSPAACSLRAQYSCAGPDLQRHREPLRDLPWV